MQRGIQIGLSFFRSPATLVSGSRESEEVQQDSGSPAPLVGEVQAA